TDGDVDAVKLLRLVVALVQWLLVQEGVENDRRLTGLTVTDDELALTAADGDECVDGLETGGHRFVHRLARQNAGRLHVHAPALLRVDRPLPVDRIAEGVDDAAEELLANRNLDDRTGPLDGVAFRDA